jgi:hypothetical protein
MNRLILLLAALLFRPAPSAPSPKPTYPPPPRTALLATTVFYCVKAANSLSGEL